MQSTPRPAPRRGLRIFILEDHADTRNTLKKYLESQGHTVLTAASLREATIEIRNAEDVDVLLCDIGLTDGLGWTFLESLHLTKPVFAIAMSAASSPEARARSLSVGFRHHLVKPFEFDLLHRVLDEAISHIPEQIPRRRVLIE